MSAELWSASERFYETILPVTAIGMLLLLQISFFVFTYTTGIRRKKITFSLLAGISLILTYSVWGYTYYSEYLDDVTLVTPLIRDREWKFFGYKYYSLDRQETYRTYNGLEKMEKLSFYKAKEMKVPLNFLGKNGYYYYFEDVKGGRFKKTKGVEFSSTSPDTYLTGKRFSLTDPAFEEIGFVPATNILYERIVVPKEFEDRTFHERIPARILKADEHFTLWNF